MRSGVEDSKKTYPRIGRVRDSRQERLRTDWKGTRSVLVRIEGILFEMLSSKEFVTSYNRATRCARRAPRESIKVRWYTYIDIKYIYFPGRWLSGFSNRRSNQRRVSKGSLPFYLPSGSNLYGTTYRWNSISLAKVGPLQFVNSIIQLLGHNHAWKRTIPDL